MRTLEKFKEDNKHLKKDQLLEMLYDQIKYSNQWCTELKNRKEELEIATKKLHEQEVLIKQFTNFKRALAFFMKDDLEEIATEIAKDISEEGISKYEEDGRDSEWEARVGLEA